MIKYLYVTKDGYKPVPVNQRTQRRYFRITNADDSGSFPSVKYGISYYAHIVRDIPNVGNLDYKLIRTTRAFRRLLRKISPFLPNGIVVDVYHSYYFEIGKKYRAVVMRGKIKNKSRG